MTVPTRDLTAWRNHLIKERLFAVQENNAWKIRELDSTWRLTDDLERLMAERDAMAKVMGAASNLAWMVRDHKCESCVKQSDELRVALDAVKEK